MSITIDFGPNVVGTITSGIVGDKDSYVRVPAVGVFEAADGATSQVDIGPSPDPEVRATWKSYEDMQAWQGSQPAIDLSGLGTIPSGAISTLSISDAKFDDEAVASLAAFAGVKSISVGSALLTDAGVKVLASFEGLESLQFQAAELTDESLSILSGLTSLTSITAGGAFTSQGLKALSMLPSLTTLTIRGGNFDDTVGEVLATFPALESLGLGSESVTDVACAGLASISTITSLELSRTSITDAGALLFISLPETVTSLRLPEAVSDSMVLALRLAIPNVDLNGFWLSHKAAKKMAAKAASSTSPAATSGDVKGAAWSA